MASTQLIWRFLLTRLNLSELLIATHNEGKLREFCVFFANAGYSLLSLNDVGIHTEVEETGATLEDNAALKATTYAQLSGMATIADDSGLEVDALGGEPGVRSARFAGRDATDSERIALLLHKVDNVPSFQRTARFRCVIALKKPGKPVRLYSGHCNGLIANEARGDQGFGYDPIFFLPQLNKTMAELNFEEKNAISHRGHAVAKVANDLSLE